MRFLFIFFCLCVAALPARAQEMNAYMVPEGKAYVRVMNFSKDALEGYKLNGQEMDVIGPQKIGPYYAVEGYAAKLHHGQSVKEKPILPGRFYSFILMMDDNALLFAQEEKLLNPSKAFIHFYNLTDRPTLELKSDDGKSLVSVAKKGSVGSRDIRALPAKLGIYANRSLVAEVPKVNLQAGKATTIVVIGAGKGLKVITNE